MRLRDRAVVVTGGGSGIGAALCRRFAAEGARGILVADLDASAAEAVAVEVGGIGVACDVTREADVASSVERARSEFGPIDLYCANAGIAVGMGTGTGTSGPFAPDADWTRSFDVHVMAHVYAARAVLPAMLERGEGYFLTTASAAGLLTDITGHAYSVTKHAAVGFAEWLAIAYGPQGLRVSCLCPQGVVTPLLESVAAQMGGGGHLVPDAIEPDEVAEVVVTAIDREEFLILPHPVVKDYAIRRASDTDRWIHGMTRMRNRIYSESD